MSQRLPQINELIKRELSQILLREVDFPKGILVTIIKVETSSDISQVKVWASTIPEKQADMVLQILNKQIYFIQQYLNKQLKMRPVPKIKFMK